VIIPDVNPLLHAYNGKSAEHERGQEWWENTLAGAQAVGLAWAAMLGFIRIMTQRGVMRNPKQPGEALGHLRGWLERPQAEILTPGEEHARILFGRLEQSASPGNSRRLAAWPRSPSSIKPRSPPRTRTSRSSRSSAGSTRSPFPSAGAEPAFTQIRRRQVILDLESAAIATGLTKG